MCDSECLMCCWENKYRMCVLIFDSFNRDHSLFATFNLLHWSFSPFYSDHCIIPFPTVTPLTTSSSPLPLLCLLLNTFCWKDFNGESPHIKPQMGFYQSLPKYHIHPSIIYTVYPAKGCGDVGARVCSNPARGGLHTGQIANMEANNHSCSHSHWRAI